MAYPCFATLILASIVGSSTGLAAPAPTIDGYLVDKMTYYVQTSSATPVNYTNTNEPDGPFNFVAYLTGNSLNLLSPGPKITLPNSTQYNLVGNSTAVTFQAGYASKSLLDAAFPNGAYSFTAGGSTLTISLGVSDAYPTNTPQITNGNWDEQGFLVINSVNGATLNFNNFSEYLSGTGGEVIFSLYTFSGNALGNELVSVDCVALSGYPSDPVLTSYTIPAGLLQPDQTYFVEVSFVHLTNLNITALPTLGMASFSKATGFMISTATPATMPVIATQPASQTVTVGANVTFNAAASGNPAPTFQWRKNGANIGGATLSLWTLNNVQLSDAGSYTVVASNSAGSAISSPATLTVNPAAIAPTITTQPASQVVTAGSTVTFTAVANGTPAPIYQWQKNGSPIGGATNSSYTIVSVAPGDAGSYTVVATNSVSSATSNPATLTVNVVPAITLQLQNQTVTAGNAVTFTVAASGTPAPTFQWKKNNVTISGATSSSYTIAVTVAGDAGSYTVVATNSVGTATSNAATLTVNTGPVLTLQPVSQSVNAGAPVTFTAAASGTPAPTYQWQKNGSPIGGATGSSFTIASTVPGDLVTYTVVATNIVGSTTSNPATLIFNVAPAINTQPGSQTVMAGNPVTFTVVASGIPAPTFQWRKNGVNIAGATSNSLVIGSASAEDTGTYSVVATNPVGSATSAGATLTIQAAPFNLSSPLWLNPSAGLCSIWLMNGTTFGSGASLGMIPTAWQVVAAPDFNGDGQPDILWQNPATGQRRIWLMNGTNFSSEIDLGTYDPAWQMVTAVDFNGDGQSDILWQNTATGQRTIWLMNGTAYMAGVDFGIYDVSWQMVTAVDFNGDGFPDILWQNKVTGQRTIWLMNGTAYMAGIDFGIYDIRWQMMTAADFNGDGHPDILWQNTATGQRTIWLMNGTTYNSAVNLGLQNPRWRAAAVADFNGDGQPDILWQANPAPGDFNGDGHHDIIWQNTATGRCTIWQMNGTTFCDPVYFGYYDVSWQIVIAVDFDGDGQSDLLWQNTATGQRRIWLMQGCTFSAEVDFGTYDISWQMVAVADFNNDGHPDILWQNAATGQRVIWLMNGTAYMAAIDFGIYDVSWQLVTAADFDGDGHPDILWQNTADGRRTIWLMNGTAFRAAIDFGTYDVNWRMVAAADFNDDSQTDILWQNTVTGQRSIWLMNGTTFGSAVDLGTYDLNWQMRN